MVNSNPIYVSYGTKAPRPGSSPILVRRYCAGSASEVDSTISENLFTWKNQVTPNTVATISNACGPGVSSCASTLSSTGSPATVATISIQCLDSSTDTSCADNGVIPTYPINGTSGIGAIVLTVTELQSGYQYSLTAAPRNQAPINEISPGNTVPPGNGPRPPGSTAPALLLLGSGSGVLSCSGSGHGGPVTVNGTAAVDSSSPGSMALGGGDTLTASQV